MRDEYSKEGIETRSEEVQEIISRMPGWIISYGATLLFIILLGIFWMAWFIRYPDIIKANIIITTNPPPVTLVARSAGKLTLLKQENEKIAKGAIIAYIQSGASLNDVLTLENSINLNTNYQSICLLKNNSYRLGELHSSLNELIRVAEALRIFYENDLVTKQIKSLESQIISYQKLSANLKRQQKLQQNELQLATEKFNMDSLLFIQQRITRQEYNAAVSVYLGFQRDFMSFNATLITNELQITQMKKQMDELKAAKLDKENQLLNDFSNKNKELLTAIETWKEKYLFTSPMEGKVAYLSFLETNQYIESGSSVFTIVPNTTALYGKVDLPISESGKVKENQRVNIMLDNYPYEQYGMLNGEVQSISLLPKEDVYKVTIRLPLGLQSTHNKTLPFHEQLQGQTEIITEDLRLSDRIFYQLRSLIN